jgi:hypothetical protein
MRTPLKGHPYHSKSDAELHYIIKDAGEARYNAHGMGDRAAHSKYADQVNDAVTVLHYRRNGGKQLERPVAEAWGANRGDVFGKSRSNFKRSELNHELGHEDGTTRPKKKPYDPRSLRDIINGVKKPVNEVDHIQNQIHGIAEETVLEYDSEGYKGTREDDDMYKGKPQKGKLISADKMKKDTAKILNKQYAKTVKAVVSHKGEIKHTMTDHNGNPVTIKNGVVTRVAEENLDELSKGTLKSYIEKTNAENTPTKKIGTRISGLWKANKKLAKKIKVNEDHDTWRKEMEKKGAKVFKSDDPESPKTTRALKVVDGKHVRVGSYDHENNEAINESIEPYKRPEAVKLNTDRELHDAVPKAIFRALIKHPVFKASHVRNRFNGNTSTYSHTKHSDNFHQIEVHTHPYLTTFHVSKGSRGPGKVSAYHHMIAAKEKRDGHDVFHTLKTHGYEHDVNHIDEGFSFFKKKIKALAKTEIKRDEPKESDKAPRTGDYEYNQHTGKYYTREGVEVELDEVSAAGHTPNSIGMHGKDHVVITHNHGTSYYNIHSKELSEAQGVERLKRKFLPFYGKKVADSRAADHDYAAKEIRMDHEFSKPSESDRKKIRSHNKAASKYDDIASGIHEASRFGNKSATLMRGKLSKAMQARLAARSGVKPAEKTTISKTQAGKTVKKPELSDAEKKSRLSHIATAAEKHKRGEIMAAAQDNRKSFGGSHMGDFVGMMGASMGRGRTYGESVDSVKKDDKAWEKVHANSTGPIDRLGTRIVARLMHGTKIDRKTGKALPRTNEDVEQVEESKITKPEAEAALEKSGSRGVDFHTLRSDQVQRLHDFAKELGYRKSKTAPGSTARMFHQHLHKIVKEETVEEELKVGEKDEGTKSRMRRKYLGNKRGRTATGSKAHAVDVEPTLTTRSQ